MTEETQEVQAEVGTNIYKKMVEAMKAIKKLPKNGLNPHYKYKYVTDEDVMEHMRKALSGAGIAIVTNITEVIKDLPGRVAVWLDIAFVDSDSGESVPVRWYAEADSSTKDKAVNIAVTAGIKYCLLKTFLVSTGSEEDDADAGKETELDPNLASEKQKNAIASMFKKLGAANVNKQLKLKGYPEIAKLTKEQASELFKKLQEAIAEKENPKQEESESPPKPDPF